MKQAVPAITQTAETISAAWGDSSTLISPVSSGPVTKMNSIVTESSA